MIKCPQCPYEAVSVQWLERHMDDAHSRQAMQSSLLEEARERLQQLLDAKKREMAWEKIDLQYMPQMYVEIEDFLKRSKEAVSGR